ncbi:D-arabinono-1,4-lactone oxidase [Terrabacter sp. MAHUQ-38]|jgi:xylitol oxidase|uniref:D-arabinono-1,4-lactone oxidase n=1 Tax=unclassified Terrabacter TaxID=2630222 RepID=UPI00165D5D95|nr:D-arabinono-1,4-lactone oxidase [Terrabacter sp. MAHUQ-38]MBC9823782.1 FAD-binding protein [Terrabacter sp. MAHUQ-38]
MSIETNWAGNHTYRARIERPRSVDELQDVVAREARVRALGSRHSFTDLTDITDSDAGVLVSLADIPTAVDVDESTRRARVTGRAAYGEVATQLQAAGWALANLASLPHISVAGAVATGTHGSGVENGSLATSVASLDIVGSDGEIRKTSRGDADFDGSVVALGALGVVTAVTLDIEPTFEVRQDVYTGLAWDALVGELETITKSAYSVSLFTRWTDAGIEQVWLKSRADDAPTELFGALAATTTMHMLEGGATESVTQQGGLPGPWLDRLPHFRMEFTPSRGEELQSEYLLPREHALTAIERLRALGERMAPVLQVCELRTVAADEHWLSSAYGHDVLGVHFTWLRDVERVYAVLPAIEAALLPLGARPHWGKCFVAEAADLEPMYPRMSDFRALRDRVDPDRTFGNAFLDRVLG